jgi:hydroxypyruvate isomerase
MKVAICFEMLYPELSVNRKIEQIKSKGFDNIEFWSWKDKNLESIQKLCTKNDVNVVNFSGQRRGDLIKFSTHSLIMDDFANSIKAAQKLNCKTLMVLTNELGDEGVVVNSYPDILNQGKFDATVKCLKDVLELLPEDMTLVMEPLNTVLDHKGYYLYEISSAAKIIDEVCDPRLKVLCDLYHQAMMGDDLDFIIEKYIDKIGHFHIADVPGRHEPGTGEINWLEILRKIKRTGYKGVVGFEYLPKNNSDESLDRIKELCEKV